MEQLIIAGYIPFTNTQISFTAYAVALSVAAASWYYWSLGKHLKHPEAEFAPTISPDL